MENSINKDFLLTNALNSATALKGLLEQEFEALKSQNIADFEKLQPKKTEIISLLSNPELSNIVKNNASIELTKSTLGIWDNLTTIISECKDLHRRNEIFINRKLESIKGALNTIQTPDPISSVEVYDRLGKVRKGKVRQNVGKAWYLNIFVILRSHAFQPINPRENNSY